MKNHTKNPPKQQKEHTAPILPFAGPAAKLIFPLAAILFVSALAFWPVDTLIIGVEEKARTDFSGSELDKMVEWTGGRTGASTVFRSAVPSSQNFWTGYIHSVQRTPVLDCYHVTGSRIWSWRELVQSHNAGLPFQAPPYGRFYMDSPWMIIEGGRRDWEEIFLRVGDKEFGRNVFAIKQGRRVTRIALYADYPGKRLKLETRRLPLVLAAAGSMCQK